MNTITIEFCAEDRARLDAIIAGLDRQNNHNCAGCVQAAVSTAVAIAKDPDNVDPRYLEPEANGNTAGQAMEHPADAPTAQFEVVDAPTPWDNEPKPSEPTHGEDKQPEQPKPIDKETYRARVAKHLANGGDREALKTYLEQTYGVSQVTAVPEDKRAEVLAHIGA